MTAATPVQGPQRSPLADLLAFARLPACRDLFARVDARKPDGAERGLARGVALASLTVAARYARARYGLRQAISSIFLAREFGVQVWATKYLNKPTENWERIRAAGVEDRVFPVYAEAHALPYAECFFDAAISLDAYHYFGTDDLYLGYYARYVKPGGLLGLVVPGLAVEFTGEVPSHLAPYWERDFWSFHSPDWWSSHWARTGPVEGAPRQSGAERLATLAGLAGGRGRTRLPFQRGGSGDGATRRRTQPRFLAPRRATNLSNKHDISLGLLVGLLDYSSWIAGAVTQEGRDAEDRRQPHDLVH